MSITIDPEVSLMGSGTDYPPGSASARRGRLGDGAPEAIRQDDVEPTGYHGGRGGNLRQSTARVRLAHTPTARWNRSSRRHWPFPTRGPLRPSRRRSMSASSTTRPTRVPARARVALYTQRVSPSVAVREGRSPRDQRLAPSPVSPAKRSRTSLKRLGHAVEPRSASPPSRSASCRLSFRRTPPSGKSILLGISLTPLAPSGG